MLEHFQVLPTEERYKKLTTDQVEVLFLNFLMSPTAEEYKNAYREGKREEQAEEDFPKEELEGMGYTEEEIEQMKQDLARGK